MCPVCGAHPVPGRDDCPGCHTRLRTSNGCLDLLAPEHRAEADHYARRYEALRLRERWPGVATPERTALVARAAALFRGMASRGTRPLVVDVGSAGGWAAGQLGALDVIAIDLRVASAAGVCTVRADMRALPLREASVDGALFAASIHYAPLEETIPEVARVLRPGGLLAVVDSPIYPTKAAQADARERSLKYFRDMGFPELGPRYHPIAAPEFRDELVRHGFRIDRFEAGSAGRLLRRLARRAPGTFVVAAKMPLP